MSTVGGGGQPDVNVAQLCIGCRICQLVVQDLAEQAFLALPAESVEIDQAEMVLGHFYLKI